jgi:hypothetical protein
MHAATGLTDIICRGFSGHRLCMADGRFHVNSIQSRDTINNSCPRCIMRDCTQSVRHKKSPADIINGAFGVFSEQAGLIAGRRAFVDAAVPAAGAALGLLYLY